MKHLNGGYVMLDLNDTNNIYTRAKNIIGSGKPVMVFDDPDVYYADSISLNGDDDVVIIKGGKTITIEDDGTITEVGNVLTIMENIVDKNGNHRFFDLNGENSIIEGFTFSYSKASLSGTHLLIVLAGSVLNTTAIADRDLALFRLPDWVLTKIFPIWADKYIETKSVTFMANDWSAQTMLIALAKEDNGLVLKKTGGDTVTFTADRQFRVEFDLLIDAE